MHVEEAVAFAAASARDGGTVVFTNGVFDLLHPGHVRYLHDAPALGDALIVGVNSDRSVRAIKGPTGRSTPKQSARKSCWRSHAWTRSSSSTRRRRTTIISAVQPDILVKGADWGPDNIVGRDIVEARGGRVVRIALAPGYLDTTESDPERSRRLACA